MKYILEKEKTVAIGKTLEESGWGPFQFPVLYKGIDGRIYIYFHCDLDNWQSFGKGNERWMVTNDLGDSWEDVEKDIVYQNIGLKISNGDYLLSTLRSNPPVDLDKIKLPIKISIDTVPGENIHYKSNNINEYPLPRGTYTDIFGHRVSSFATKELPDGLYEHLDDLPMLRRTKDGKVNFE